MERLKIYKPVPFEQALDEANVNNRLKKYLLSIGLESAVACLEDVVEVEGGANHYLLLERAKSAWFRKKFLRSSI